jgi:hypothetical protein
MVTQQRGAKRRHIGPSWLEVSGFGVNPNKRFQVVASHLNCLPFSATSVNRAKKREVKL